MNVEKLIKMLSGFPPDAEVFLQLDDDITMIGFGHIKRLEFSQRECEEEYSIYLIGENI